MEEAAKLRKRDWSDYLGGVVFFVALLMMVQSGWGVTPLHHWTLDAWWDYPDSIGSWDLTSTGNAPGLVAGVFGNANKFNGGATGYLNINTREFNESWTACGWINPYNATTTASFVSMEYVYSAATYTLMQFGQYANSTIYAEYSAPSGVYGLYSNTLISTGVWYHICVVWDYANRNMSMWVNGTLDNSKIMGDPQADANATRIEIGGSQIGDEIWLFDGTLTGMEIRALMTYNDIPALTTTNMRNITYMLGYGTITPNISYINGDGIGWAYAGLTRNGVLVYETNNTVSGTHYTLQLPTITEAGNYTLTASEPNATNITSFTILPYTNYLPGWHHSKMVWFEGVVAGSQGRIVVNNSEFSDIDANISSFRAYTADGTELYTYTDWMLNSSDTTHNVYATFNDPYSDGVYVILYWDDYQKMTPTWHQNYGSTRVYDDFEDGTINDELWGTYAGGTETGGYLQLYKSGTISSGYYYSKQLEYYQLPLYFTMYRKTVLSSASNSYTISYIYGQNESGWQLLEERTGENTEDTYNYKIYYNQSEDKTYLYRDSGTSFTTIVGSMGGKLTNIKVYAKTGSGATGNTETIDLRMYALGSSPWALEGYTSGVEIGGLWGSPHNDTNDYFFAYNEDDTNSIQSFSVQSGSTTATATEGYAAIEHSSVGATASFGNSNYATRTVRVTESKPASYDFYSIPSPNYTTLNIDVRNSTNFSTEPNKDVEIWWNGLHLHDGTSDSNGLLRFEGSPLKEYTIKWDNQSAPWEVSVVIGQIKDEKTGDAIYADVTLTNGTKTTTYENTTWVAIGRYEVANYTIPWGDVSVSVGSDTYPTRLYKMEITGDTRHRLKPYLLNVFDGVYVNFVTESADSGTEPNSVITMRRLYDTTYQTVAQIVTDSAGQGSMFLDPYYRYRIHAETEDGSKTYDGEVQVVSGTTYHILFSGGSVDYVVTQPTLIRVSPSKPAYGENLTVEIYDSHGSLTGYTITLKNTTTEMYSTSGTNPDGETFVIDTSTLPAPESQFTPYQVVVTFNTTEKAGLDYVSWLYFSGVGEITGLGKSLAMGLDNVELSPEMRTAISIVVIIAFGGSLVTISYTLATIGVVLAAIMFGYAGWLDLRVVLLAIALVVMIQYSRRRMG